MKPILKFLYKSSKNKKTIHFIFKAFDRSTYERYFIALNSNTPAYLLEFLSKDKDYDVRSAVASNQNTPIHVLEHLRKDMIWRVYYRAIQNLNCKQQKINI